MPFDRLRFQRVCFSILSLAGVCDCDPATTSALDMNKPTCVTLDASLSWYGKNRDTLDQMMRTNGVCSASYDGKQKPVAIFDWDNTVVKNDVGDATFFYMLAHDLILQPPMKNWRFTSRYLTADATAALDAACGALAQAGSALPTSSNMACAKEILTIYTDGKTVGGKTAFAGWDYRRMEPSYAWVAQLLGGYSAAQIQATATAAKTESLAKPIDSKQTIGGVQVTNWVRIYDQMRDLIRKLQQNGIDVWVLSASPQPIVEVWGAEVGVSADHVIGIRSVEQGGKYTYDLMGCGDVPNGSNDGAGNDLALPKAGPWHRQAVIVVALVRAQCRSCVCSIGSPIYRWDRRPSSIFRTCSGTTVSRVPATMPSPCQVSRVCSSRRWFRGCDVPKQTSTSFFRSARATGGCPGWQCLIATCCGWPVSS